MESLNPEREVTCRRRRNSTLEEAKSRKLIARSERNTAPTINEPRIGENRKHERIQINAGEAWTLELGVEGVGRTSEEVYRRQVYRWGFIARAVGSGLLRSGRKIG
jgi:hypothetical protein